MKLLIIIGIFLNSQELKKTMLTVYSDNFAVVSQNYSAECKKENNSIVLLGMPRTMISDSFSVFMPKGFSIISYGYKSNEENYINQKVEILTEDNSIIKGTLLRDGETCTLIDEKGNYLTLNRKYIKFINYGEFDEKNYRKKLKNTASIIINLNSKENSNCSFEAKYIINSLNWSCSYDAYLNEDETLLDIRARVNIINDTGHDFKNTSLMLVAGNVNKINEYSQIFRAMPKSLTADASYEGVGGEIRAEEVSEQYSYKIPLEGFNLNDGEAVSIDLFSRNGIKFEKYYVYKGQMDSWYFYDTIRNYRYDKKLLVNIVFRNNKENSMDIPLPQGKIRIYKKKDGFTVFAGEDNIKNMPVNSKIEILAGKAFNVEGERKIVEHKKIVPNVYRDTIEIKIRNEKKEPINVKVKEYLWGRWKIVESSHKYDKVDANNIEFDINIAPQNSQIIKYTAEYDFNN